MIRGRSFRLAALDLDGTLLNGEGQIISSVRRSLRRVRRAGLRVVLATGRSAVEARAIWDQAGGGEPLIACGGAMIANPALDLIDYSLPLEAVWEGAEALERVGLDVLAYVLVTKGVDLYHWGDAKHLGMKAFLRGKEHRLQRIARGEGMPPVGRLVAFGSPRVVEKTAGKMGVKVAWREKDVAILELAHPRSNKAQALDHLAQRWNIGREEILAIGNHYNDLEMFAYAGCSVAMANSPPEVIAAADFLTSSNEEDGVATILDSLFRD